MNFKARNISTYSLFRHAHRAWLFQRGQHLHSCPVHSPRGRPYTRHS